MERDVRYLLVGIALACLIAGLIGIAVWQTQRFGDRAGEQYTLFVETSAAGLGSGSSVRYMGMRVGRVDRLRLTPEAPERIEVDITVDEQVPITAATEASIEPQGVTGQSIVSLRTPRKAAGDPARVEEAPYPVLQTEPSAFDRVLSAAPELADRLRGLIDDLRAVVDADNRAHIGETLQRVAQFSQRLDDMAGQLEGLAKRGDETLHEVEEAATDVSGAAGSAEVAFAETDAAVQALQRLSERLDAVVRRNAGEIDRFAQSSLPAVGGLVREAQQTVEAAQRLIERLEDQPAQIIRSRPEGGQEVPQ